jgi:carboxyl-terminal processing protease
VEIFVSSFLVIATLGTSYPVFADATADSENNFQKAKTEILAKFIGPAITEDTLYQYALQGMLNGLNQKHPEWNKLYSPMEYQELLSELAGKIVCIGTKIALDAKSGTVNILGVLPGSPADKAGIKSEDHIIQINGKSVKGMTLAEVVGLLRGNVGEAVQLTLLRSGNVFNETLYRELIAYNTVGSEVVPGGTTIITIPEFNDSTRSQLQSALQESAQSNPNGIVIDLRQNPGGSLSGMLDTLALMIPDKTPVAIAIYRDGKHETIQTKGTPTFVRVPLAVIVDGGTACGAEMMANTLRNSIGAIVVGSQTFGKWNSQTVEEFPNHFAMKYTIATLRGPKGEVFDGIGITPDVVSQSEKPESLEGFRHLAKDAVLNKAISILKQ